MQNLPVAVAPTPGVAPPASGRGRFRPARHLRGAYAITDPRAGSALTADEDSGGGSLVGSPFPTAEVGGVRFQVTTLEAACEWLLTVAARERDGVNVRLANAYNVALANNNSAYGELLKNEGINFPDGTPVAWFMRYCGASSAGRVRGPSLFPLALGESAKHGTRHFLLGGAPETLTRLERNIASSFPNVIIAGSYSPPFTEIDAAYVAECARRIEAASPDIVWIGLGTPKQDYLGALLAREIDTVSVNVGAAFDFLAGTSREAPAWVQRSGFEWLFRLLVDPRRLWRRYLVGNMQFLWAATRHAVRTSRARARSRT